jgi:hypothetical protein
MRMRHLPFGLVVAAMLWPCPSAIHAVEAPIRVRAVGDIAIAGTMRDEVLGNHLDPFAGVASVIREADVAFANLEAVLTRRAPPVGTNPSETGPLLRSLPEPPRRCATPAST